MIKFATDEDFNNRILRGVLRRQPRLDIVRVQDALTWEERGVFEVGQDLPIGQAIEEILLVAECSLEGEWEGQIRFLPLR
jgi:hypothetical protein